MKMEKLSELLQLEYGKPLDKSERVPGSPYKAYGANGPISDASKALVKGPGIIVGRKGSAGEITEVQEDFWPLDVTYYVTHDKKKTDLRFLYFLLLSLDLKQFVRGVKPGLNRNDAYGLLVPLPSLPEQKAIVEKLDSAFAEIDKLELVVAKRESLLMKLEDQFLSSRFLTPAGPSSQLGDVANIRTGPFGSILHKSDYVGSGVPIINPTNLVDGEIEPSKCVSSEFAMKLSSYQVEEGDIVMGRRGDLGRCAVVKAEQSGWLCGTGSFVIRTNQRVRPRFLALVLSANKTREALTAISTGATMENLNNRELSKLLIWIPSITEQEETLRLWDLLAAQIVEMKKSHMVKSRRLIQLRQSILSDSFSGESNVA
jgi:type I restriction enzyme S subunit